MYYAIFDPPTSATVEAEWDDGEKVSLTLEITGPYYWAVTHDPDSVVAGGAGTVGVDRGRTVYYEGRYEFLRPGHGRLDIAWNISAYNAGVDPRTGIHYHVTKTPPFVQGGPTPVPTPEPTPTPAPTPPPTLALISPLPDLAMANSTSKDIDLTQHFSGSSLSYEVMVTTTNKRTGKVKTKPLNTQGYRIWILREQLTGKSPVLTAKLGLFRTLTVDFHVHFPAKHTKTQKFLL